MPKLSKYQRAVLIQEYLSAKRTISGIKKDIKNWKLPSNVPVLKYNEQRMEKAKKLLGIKD